MNIVLTTLNAKFSHSNLALRYLRAYCREEFGQIEIAEYNINQPLSLVTSELVEKSPDILGFSCYIWNIEQTLEIVSNLKKVLPHTIVVLGGPEVSFEYQELMKKHREINYLVSGEGEVAFLSLLRLLENHGPNLSEQELASVPGLVYRSCLGLQENQGQYVDLTSIPPLFLDNLGELTNKIAYYETSRGCPFNCAYCLSSRTGKVRYFPLARAKQELAILAELGVNQVRFVDRTFNCDRERALELVEFMASLKTTTRFQLEVGGDLLTDRMIAACAKAPAGRFQFEIGVQSTNPNTLQAVGRTTDLAALGSQVRQVKEKTTVTVLLDLIAGLPKEDFARFQESFDFVYQLQPDKIQLGFLKLLKGSQLRSEAESFGCLFTDKAPYEVLQTDVMSYLELRQLHRIDEVVDRVYNSGRFQHTLHYLVSHSEGPFVLLQDLATWLKVKGFFARPHSLSTLYRLLKQLYSQDYPLVTDFLRLDFRLNERKGATPKWLGGRGDRQVENRLIQSQALGPYLPEQFRSLSPRELGKRLFVEEFSHRVYPYHGGPVEKQPQLIMFLQWKDAPITTVDLTSLC